jgi:hypothetical protein
MTTQRLNTADALWLALLAATALTWALGEAGFMQAGARWPVAVVFVLAWAKGLGIALRFMELQHAPPAWRRFILGWLAVVVLAILVLAALTAA